MITIELSSQEALNQVYEHLIKQGGPAKVNDRCRYRTEDGQSCAFGCLIKEEEYDKSIEGLNLDCLVFNNKVVFKGSKTHPLCRSMQIEHDNYTSSPYMSNWSDYITRKFTEIAQRYNLEMPQ